MSAFSDRLDRFQQRHTWAGFPLAVIYKFADDQGPFLSALLTYYGFLSLFPLLLLLATSLGFLLQHNPDLQAKVLESALGQIPLIGSDLPLGRLHGSAWALIASLIGIIYGGLGVAQAGQNAMNVVWAVPRNKRPNPIASRLRSMLLLLVVGLGVVATTILTIYGQRWVVDVLGTGAGTIGHVGVLIITLVANSALFLGAFRIATARPVTLAQIAPGAIVASLVWQLLQVFGSKFVHHVLTRAGATYGVFGLVLGLLAWIYLASATVVLCAEGNVVYARRLWPRALLTPFTENVELTAADEEAYAGYAEAQRHKDFEDIDVTFHDKPPRRRRKAKL